MKHIMHMKIVHEKVKREINAIEIQLKLNQWNKASNVY